MTSVRSIFMKFFFFTLVIFLSQMSFAKKTIVLVPGDRKSVV